MENNYGDILTKENIKREVESYQAIVAYIKDNFKEGEDYGRLPDYPKPSLLKPGAEKLCSLLNLSIHVDIVEKLENFREGIFHYVCKCTLKYKDTGIVASQGLGSCNSKETKFLNQNPYSIANTILKLAKKRALVDAILTATRTSGMFTQDIEDMDDILNNKKESNFATSSQKAFIAKLAKDKGLNDTQFEEYSKKIIGKEKSSEWTKEDAAKLIKSLKNK